MADDDFDYGRAIRALIRFFQSKGHPEPEEAAQETILRFLLMRAETKIANPMAYLMGIARHVWSDFVKRQRQGPAAMLPLPEKFDERLLQCLSRCEKKLLKPSERKLLHEWFDAAGRERIKKLAERQGLTMETLRQRICRLRMKLAPCVRKCRDALERA